MHGRSIVTLGNPYELNEVHIFLSLWSPSSSMRWQCSSSEEKKEPTKFLQKKLQYFDNHEPCA